MTPDVAPSPSSASFRGKAAERLTAGEGRLVPALFLIAIVFRVLNAMNYRVDSDEPQHLHVVWGWANGLLQYRDIFDNHAPLFQMLCAPVFRLFGERPDIIIPMRLFMLPLYLGCLAGIYKIGKSLWSQRAGVWAAVLAAFEPRFFFTSTEFRTDDLWALFWLLALAVLVDGRLGLRRLFFFGLIVGATFAVSMKTSLLFFTLLAAILIVIGLKMFARDKIEWSRLMSGAVVALIGSAIIPGAIIAFFAARHALPVMYACVIQHNIVPNLNRWSHFYSNVWWFAGSLPVFIAVAHTILRLSSNRSLGARRAMIFLAPALFLTALYSFWPDITREDFLPFSPLAVLAVTALVFSLAKKFAPQRNRALIGLLCIAALGEIGLIMKMERPWRDRMSPHVKLISQVLELTRPGEFVMDGKSGAIFRPRPYYYVLETITRIRMRLRLIEDNVPERLIDTRTAVVVDQGFRTYMRGTEFIHTNYVPVNPRDELWLLGKILPPADAGGVIRFDIVVPADYVVISENGSLSGTLDNQPLGGPRALGSGHHEFRQTGGSGRIALFWATAFAKGFSPFKYQ